MIFAVIYFRTGNLFVTVGLHALVNNPMTIVDAEAVVLLPLVLVLLLLLVAWLSLIKRVGSSGR